MLTDIRQDTVKHMYTRFRQLSSSDTDDTCTKKTDRQPREEDINPKKLLLLIIMEIYAAPKLSKYMTAPGAYNVKSLIYEINQHMHEYTHTPTHSHTHTYTHTTHTNARMRAHTRPHTQARSKKFVLRKIRQRNKSRRLETLLKEMGFQSLSK